MINHWSDRVTGLELAAVERAEELLRFAEVAGGSPGPSAARFPART
jgi:hypothetical protein